MISTLLKNISLSIIPLLLVQCGTTDIPRYYRYNDIFESKFFQKEWEVISFCLEREEIEEYDKEKIEYRYICAVFTPNDNYLYCYVQHHLP